jgi:hypothetical protein
MDNLRAEGKCFNCRETGHEQRNCPKLNSMRPPRQVIKAGAISFAKMEELADRKEKADIYIGNISIEETDPIAEKFREYEEIERKVHRWCENAWGEDPLWYTEETRPDSKYGVDVHDNEITIWDFVNRRDRTFTREDVDDPNFNVAEAFAAPEPDRTPTSAREGGYPDAENYQQWDWPAIRWLYLPVVLIENLCNL